MSGGAPNAARWTREDCSADPETIAQRLIGALLVRTLDSGERLSGMIVETEAYLGIEDKAAHSYGGRRTARTEPMFGSPGHVYVYFTYGMHHCMNVVCGVQDEPVAVLIRALEPIEGVERIREFRQKGGRRKSPLADKDLCSGPAKLCQGLSIDRSLSGGDLVSGEQLAIEHRPNKDAPYALVNSRRIGIEYAEEWALRPLRWHLAKNRHVSRN
jgi:DNA-3-methyladenine glycosylase